MNKTSETDWARLDAMSESEINTSDISPLTKDCFNKSRWWKSVSPLNYLQVNPHLIIFSSKIYK